MKFVHLHIPKTAGTSLRESLAAVHPELEVRQIHEAATAPDAGTADVISGHISHEIACGYSDQIVTVLRHPVDRFVSIYFFWRMLYDKGVERSRKTTLARTLSLLEFARAMDEPELCSELMNRMSWQLHSSFRLNRRFDIRRDRALTQTGLAAGALENLRGYAAVGFQDRYGDFVETLNARFDLKIPNRKINVTANRSAVEDLTHAELTAILPWVAADMELYAAARRHFG